MYPSIEGVPHAGSRSGRRQIEDFFQTLSSGDEILEFTQHDFIAQGDKVVVPSRYRARIRSTGRQYETDIVNIWTIGNRKIQKVAIYLDTAGYASAYRQSASAGT